MVLASKQKRPVSIQHKKRHGQHHKHTHNYTKTYWPYLPLLLIIALGITFNSLWANSGKNVLGYSTDMSGSELLSYTNQQRSSSGLLSLSDNSELDAAAQAKADNMAQLNYWSHDTPSGQPPWVFITNAGYKYTTAGENLAYGFDTSQDVITAWMNSADHRANILDSSFKDVGFGIANAADYQSSGPETIVVAEYAEPAMLETDTAPQTSVPAPSHSYTNSNPSTSNPAPSPTPQTPPASQSQSTEKNTIVPKPSSPNLGSKSNNTVNVIPADASYVRPKSINISRIQLLSDTESPWSVFAVTAIASICFLIFTLKHLILWKKVIKDGERFAIKYHLLDVILIVVGVLGFLLSRSAGIIH